jgi:hypothetical protein
MPARRAGLALLIVLTFHAIPAAADVTGTWNGSGVVNDICHYTDPQGRPISVPFSGNITLVLTLLQTGGLVNGTLETDNVPDTNATCQVTGTKPPKIVPLSGTISGSSMSATAIVAGDHGPVAVPINATVNGSSMSFNIPPSPETSFSGTLNQTSTQPPASTFTGTYSGSYNGVIVPCGSPPGVAYSGTMTAGLIQAGTTLSGSVTISDNIKDDCGPGGTKQVVHLGPATFLLMGQVSGNSFTGTLIDDRGKSNAVSATISGNSITGSGPAEFPGESFSFTITRFSTGIPAPAISTFTASPSTINAGDSSTLSWSTINASSLSIDNGIGTQPVIGTITVSPKATTTYTLTVTGPGGNVQGTTTVTVTGAGARVIVGTLPAGMLQATGASGATDSFTLSNVGTAAASVTLTQSGNFFTIAPASFTLAPGSSQFVTLTASTQAAGSYDGSVSVSTGGTVSVHLLVAAPPAAPVLPQATTTRSDVAAPASQNPSGSVSFKNNGTGTLQGIAVADVPWIVPQTGVITIGPGQTTTVTFSIDRSKRPDSAALAGGLAGRISIVYLNSVSGKRPVELGTTPTGSVSVTIVDVVKPDVAAGSPPPLAAGEVALFIDGLRTANRFNGDLQFSNRNSVSDLKLFLIAAGQQQTAALPAFPSNAGLSFPAVIKNVFGVTGAGGSLQMRSAQNANISVSAVVSTNGTNTALASSTALPILRSDRSIAAGERLVLTGAEVSSSSTDSVGTTVLVQETSGNAGHVTLEFRDQNGGVAGTDSESINAFGFVFTDAPAGTRSIIVNNDSSGAARLTGYAIVTADGSGDSWVLTDPLRQWGSASGALIVPMVATGSQADVYITNASNTAVNVTVDVGSFNRHHAVRTAGGGGQVTPQASTIAPMTTSRMSFPPTNGFVRITAASGSVSAVGRVTTSVNGTSIGSSLPAIPSSVALGNGQGKRFTGVDDASAKTVAAGTPATYRSTLMLIETAGQSATVRVTLRYNFVAGSTVSSQAVSSKDFALGPNQVLTIADLGRAIIGSQRDAFGDLRNMQVDIDVTDGGGKVLPFMESIDNASGDIAMRAE